MAPRNKRNLNGKQNGSNSEVEVLKTENPTQRYKTVQRCTLQEVPRPATRIKVVDDREAPYEVDEQDKIFLKKCPIPEKQFAKIMDCLEETAEFVPKSKDFEKSYTDECCICDEKGENGDQNELVTCRMCCITVHQNCYGVPEITDEAWFCRKCMATPSSCVHCVLCPNFDGAYKPADDMRWAHVKCAMVNANCRFGNPVFMEPIEGIIQKPQHRLCYICKIPMGVAVKCSQRNCCKLFHATCPNRAGQRISKTSTGKANVGVRMKPLCPDHLNQGSNSRRTIKAEQGLILQHQATIPSKPRKTTVHIPVIPKGRNLFGGLDPAIAKRVMNYWKIKRQYQNGRVLKLCVQNRIKVNNKTPSTSQNWKRSLRSTFELLRQFRKETLSIELQKSAFGSTNSKKVQGLTGHRRFRPHGYGPFFSNLIEKICQEDHKKCFASAVDTKKEPDYLSKVTRPMDLSIIMENWIRYSSVDKLQEHFNLMIHNNLTYFASKPGRVIYKEAKRLKEWSVQFFETARAEFENLKA